MIPFDSLDKRGYLKGVKIGKYPKPIAEFPNFTKPKGFIVVTPDNLDTPGVTALHARDFAPRSIEGFPKYMVLREELLIKLELLTDLVQARGFKFDRFTVFSGYRPRPTATVWSAAATARTSTAGRPTSSLTPTMTAGLMT